MTKRDLKNLLNIRLGYFNKIMVHLGRTVPDSFISARLKELQPQIEAAAKTCNRVTDLERAAQMVFLSHGAADMMVEGRPEMATRLLLALEKELDALSITE